jgi:hypothetical protein
MSVTVGMIRVWWVLLLAADDGSQDDDSSGVNGYVWYLGGGVDLPARAGGEQGLQHIRLHVSTPP